MILNKFFNRCIEEGCVPGNWKNAVVILIHKKGDKVDLRNYHLMNHLQGVFMHPTQEEAWYIITDLNK